MPQQNASQSEQLKQQLESLADTLEEVLTSSSGKPEDEVNRIREKAEKILKDSRKKIEQASDKIMERTKDIADCADKFVHEKPWHGVAAATAIGVVIGMILSRR